MNLLIKKTRNRHAGVGDGIRISKASFTIQGTAFDRLVNIKDGISAGVGINQEGNICLYTSVKKHSDLYRMYFPKNYQRTARVSLDAKKVGNALTPYVGVYEIKYVSINGQEDGVVEVVLKKI
jgi:hypothetical protein